jgi:hypothetical protein
MRVGFRHGIQLSAALLGGVALAGGCQILLGLDPVQLAPDGGAGGTGGGAGGCAPASGTCVAAPAGWSPVALTLGACPAGFSSPQTYVSSVTAMPYVCNCSCSGTQSCSGTITLDEYPDNTCSGSPLSSTVLPYAPVCQQSSVTGQSIVANHGYTLSSFDPVSACVGMGVPTSMPTPMKTTVTVCQATLACTGGACLSAAEQPSMCISQAGSMACPAGFPNQTLVSMGVADGRGCSACTCGSLLRCAFMGGSLSNTSSCFPDLTLMAAGCASTANGFSLDYIQGNIGQTGSGTCTPNTPSNAAGEATLDPTTTMTVCCPP